MKQHEVLAIEHDKKQKAGLVLGEALHTFDKKQNLFAGHRKSYTPFDSEDTTKQIPPDVVEVQNTVIDKIDYVTDFLADKIDIIMTKEMTNAGTTATLKINNKDVTLTAPAILALEKEVLTFRDFLRKVPTLPNDSGWSKSEDKENIWQTAQEDTMRTAKMNKAIVLYPATEKFPAQTQMAVEDVNVGTWHKQSYSGCMSSKDKADMLNRADEILFSIQQARARANDIDAKETKIGAALLKSIVTG